MRRSTTVVVLTAIMTFTGAISATAFGWWTPDDDWSEAKDIEAFGPGAHENFNTDAVEGCPFISRDGKMFFMASDRDDGVGGLDIWVSTRDSRGDPWGEPVNLGKPINSDANDFCPTIARDGRTFYFVSTREGHCGDDPNGDIYRTRFQGGDFEVASVEHLGCDVNSAWDEHSPFPAIVPGKGLTLYYSSARPADARDEPGDHDIYYSLWRGEFLAGEQVEGINTTAYNEGQPNLGFLGQEIFFWSDREGTFGGQDIFSASKEWFHGSWSRPENLGPNVNTEAGESRPSLAWGGRTLYFGRAGDIYATTR